MGHRWTGTEGQGLGHRQGQRDMHRDRNRGMGTEGQDKGQRDKYRNRGTAKGTGTEGQ